MVHDLTLTTPGPLCYYADAFSAEPIRMGSFVGSVAEGGPVNHRQVRFTPHGTGTHTECYGHISSDPEATIDRCLTQFRFPALLLSAEPEDRGDDRLITLASLEKRLEQEAGRVEALILRTLPNSEAKRQRNYSGSNPPYLEAAIARYLVELGILHMLVDLPSVDREEDGGALAFHRAFWQTEGPGKLRAEATITELIYVPEDASDGLYTVTIAPARWRLDAAPSRVWIES